MPVVSYAMTLKIFVIFAWAGSALAQTPPSGKLPAGIEPLSYHLELEVDPEQETFAGQVRIAVKMAEQTSKFWLHGQGLTPEEAYFLPAGGGRIAASYSEIGKSGVVQITSETPVGPGTIDLVVRYSAPFGQSLRGLYKTKAGERSYAYTHLQPLAARQFFPSFDEPRFKTPFDISVIIAEKNQAVSNAPLRKTEPLGDGRQRLEFARTKPMPTYLVALAVGEFDIVEWTPMPPNEVRAHPVPLRGIAPKGKGGKLNHALRHTAELLVILERYFAIPYPYAKLDLVAPVAFSPAGMENVGAFFYRQERILLDENPSIWAKRDYAGVHVHELSHSWFGNLVTPEWWDDIWLNEAFATWITSKILHAWRPEEYDGRGPLRSARRAMWNDKLVSARQIRQPVSDNHGISNVFDSITYSKGSGVLAMIERFMGEEAFRAGVRRFIADNQHGTANAETFFKALSASANTPDVLVAMRSFVEQPGTPLVAADWTCGTDGSTHVKLRQSRGLPLGSKGEADRVWSIPLCISYPEKGTAQSACTLLSAPDGTLVLPTTSCPAWIIPNSQGAAYLNFSLPDHGWQAAIEILDQLPPAEALAVIGSLHTSYEGGLVSTDLILKAARIAAKSPHRDVAKAPIQGLRNLKLFVLPKTDREAALTLMREIYAPALARFEIDDEALAIGVSDPQLALLRGELFWFMALDAEHPELSAALGRLGRKYIGEWGEGAPNQLDKSVLHPNLVYMSLLVAARTEGIGFIETLIEVLKRSNNAGLRVNILHALGFQTDVETVRRVWQLILDPATSKRDVGRLLSRQGRRADNSLRLFEWMTANYDTLTDRVPSSWRKWLPWRASGLCDQVGRDRVDAFYAEKVKNYQGGARQLANVLEAIEICVAIRQGQRSGALEAMKAH